MFVLEWLVEQVVDLLVGLVGDQVSQRRAVEMSRKRIAALQAGQEVRIPCALRHVRGTTSRWRHGTLTLATSAGGAWVPRLRRKPALTFSRTTAHALSSRRLTGRESFGLGLGLAVLSYQVADDVIEAGVRRRDLAVLGRVVELPPRPVATLTRRPR